MTRQAVVPYKANNVAILRIFSIVKFEAITHLNVYNSLTIQDRDILPWGQVLAVK